MFHPGPWKVGGESDAYNGGDVEVLTRDGTLIAVTEAQNAALIATAPEMYEALTEALEALPPHERFNRDPLRDRIERLVQRANGLPRG